MDKKGKKILYLMLILFSSQSCIDKLAAHYYGFRIYNSSRNDMKVYADFIYPDTLLKENKPELNIIKPGKSSIVFDEDTSEESLKRYYDEGGVITVFIFSADTINKYSWDQIREDYNILQRYEFTWSDLENAGGELVYSDTQFKIQASK